MSQSCDPCPERLRAFREQLEQRGVGLRLDRVALDWEQVEAQ